jgi:beta-lactamase regulating signal transducer with metallopeptidase domain
MPWWIVALPLPAFLGAGAPAVTSGAAQMTGNHEAGPRVANTHIVAPRAGEAELSAGETPGAFDALGRLTWRSWLVLTWLGGIAWQVGRLLARRERLTRLLGRAATATEPRLLAVMEQVSRQLGLSRRPALVVTDEVCAPFVSGLSRPVVVLPRGLMAELDPEYWRGAAARTRPPQAA